MSESPHAKECKQTTRCFSLASTNSSNPEYAGSMMSTSLEARCKSRETTPKRDYRAEFRQAQNVLVKGDNNLCHARCIDLINAPNLPTEIKIETIQLMATIVPLDQARCYLDDAIRIVTEMAKKEPVELMWTGLLVSTSDLLWMIHKYQGAVKLHHHEMFRDPYVAARVKDIERKLGKGYRWEEGGQERPLKMSRCPKTLFRSLKLRRTYGFVTLRDNLEPKYSCSPCL